MMGQYVVPTVRPTKPSVYWRLLRVESGLIYLYFIMERALTLTRFTFS